MTPFETEQLAAVFDVLPLCIVILDETYHVQFCNQAASNLMGQPTVALHGQEWGRVFNVEDPRIDPFQNSQEGKGTYREWCVLVRSDDSRIQIQKCEQFLLDTGGQRRGTLITFSENTDMIHYISKLERAKERAEDATTAKSLFLANISHELRTPLNSILGMADLAIDVASSSEQIEYLSILRASSVALLQLISNLLDFIKLEGKKTGLRDSTFQLLDLVEETATQFAAQCHAKGIGIHLHIQPPIETSAIGDEARLRQILLNILSNALKFTDEGELVIGLRQLTETAHSLDELWLEWSIIDTGIGIPPGRLATIFDPFTQVDGTATRNAGGTGIGLSITKSLVELMGGSITVHSTLGKGSQFVITTKLKIGAPQRTLQGLGYQSNDTVILIVANSPGFIDSIRPWLDFLALPYEICTSLTAFHAALDATDQSILCIFSGVFTEIAMTLQNQNLPLYSKLFPRRHILSVRMNRLEEPLWQSAAFRFEAITEPVCPQKLLPLLQLLQAEFNAETPASQHYRSPQPRRILYVEDDQISANYVMNLLSGAGHNVIHVGDGQQAIEEIRSQRYEILVLDIELPQVNGFEVASLIRSGELGELVQSMPIMALTAHTTIPDQRHAELLKINAFIHKPFFPQALLFAIDRLAKQAGQNRVSEKIRSNLAPAGGNDLLVTLHSAIAQNNFLEAERILTKLRERSLAEGQTGLAAHYLKALFKARSKDVIGIKQFLPNIESAS